MALHTLCAPQAERRPEPVIFFHGAVESSRIFFSTSGRGLAPHLARHGYVAAAVDFRGHGKSEPLISRRFDFGLHEIVMEDIPRAIEAVLAETGAKRFHAVAHSFGGTLLLASLARHPELMSRCVTTTTFASRRRLRAFSLKKIYMIDLMWNRFALLLGRLYGYVPAPAFGFGAEPEPRTWHAESIGWIRKPQWIDPVDGFDYGAAWRAPVRPKPALLFLTGGGDPVLGNPSDVRDLMAECPAPVSEFRVISRASGNLQDYDHIELLTHKDAPTDHFPWLMEWIEHHTDHPAGE